MRHILVGTLKRSNPVYSGTTFRASSRLFHKLCRYECRRRSYSHICAQELIDNLDGALEHTIVEEEGKDLSTITNLDEVKHPCPH